LFEKKIYSGTSVSHMVAGGVKPGKSTVFLGNEFTQSNNLQYYFIYSSGK